MNDYQILGIAENADPKEIKRAYFRLVRQYSPETDPERFQEIREAYEHLTAPKQESAEREENTLSYPPKFKIIAIILQSTIKICNII